MREASEAESRARYALLCDVVKNDLEIFTKNYCDSLLGSMLCHLIVLSLYNFSGSTPTC
jgi:hypothetical protein